MLIFANWQKFSSLTFMLYTLSLWTKVPAGTYLHGCKTRHMSRCVCVRNCFCLCGCRTREALHINTVIGLSILVSLCTHVL